ncbi:hypothetical protein KR074_004520, partial [Drosophila pseudoananassae]
LSEEQEDECASVCYPIVKPLLRYFEKTKEKDSDLLKCRTDFSELQKRFSDLQSEDHKQCAQQVSKWQQDYSELVKSNLEVQNKYSEVQNKYAEVMNQLKDTEVKYAQLQSKHLEVDNLNTLINQKNKEIKLLKDQNRNLKKSKHNNLQNKTTISSDFPDPCPRDKKEENILREVQLPGSDPFKVVCRSDSDIGSGWLIVYRKFYNSKICNRTYEDYERGFGDVGIESMDEFFIGLNRLHRLTSGKPYEVL